MTINLHIEYIEEYDPDKITNTCKICKGTGKNPIFCGACDGKGHYKQILLYRYYDVLAGNSVQLRLEGIATTKGTPTGYWVSVGKPKFVSSYTEKRWAYPTKEQALRSYYRRKKKQVKILEMQLERAKLASKLTPDNPESERPETFDIIES